MLVLLTFIGIFTPMFWVPSLVGTLCKMLVLQTMAPDLTIFSYLKTSCLCIRFRFTFRFTECTINQKIMGSDHAPVLATLDDANERLKMFCRSPEKQAPKLCVRYWNNKQILISSFLKRPSESCDSIISAVPLPQKKKTKKLVQSSMSLFVQRPMTSVVEEELDRKFVLPSSEKQQEAKKAFSELFKQPKAPNCRHGEPCKKQRVNKSGPTKGKYFWSCARPVGKKDGKKLSEFRCEFFNWC